MKPSRERDPPTPPFLSNRRGFKPPGERILHVRIFLHESDFRGVPNDPESAAQVLMKDAFDIGLHNRSEALHPLCFCSVYPPQFFPAFLTGWLSLWLHDGIPCLPGL